VDSKLSIGRQLGSFRAARRDIEASVRPVATSVDGRRFTFQASLYVRCVAKELGSPATRDEQSLVAAVVLGDLWRRRAQRRPVLIVIDEAHNVCPVRAAGTARRARDRARRPDRRGGRKFGLYLLVSTQRPQKILGQSSFAGDGGFGAAADDRNPASTRGDANHAIARAGRGQ
jgi:hypothetical protein